MKKKRITLGLIFNKIEQVYNEMLGRFKSADEKVEAGFKAASLELESLAISVQNEFTAIRKETSERFDRVETRLDRIENITLLDHTQQVDRSY